MNTELAPEVKAVGLVKRYGTKLAVNDLSFRLEPGKITGFLGPDGAGKTSTMRLILGLIGGEGRTLYDGRSYRDLEVPGRVVGAVSLIAVLELYSRFHDPVLTPTQLRAVGFGVLYLAVVAAVAVALSAVTRSTVWAVLLIYIWGFAVEPLISLATKPRQTICPSGRPTT